jgi:putative toxin-antitoxin system antitoxin component (TIGR02293 family)
MAISLRSRGAVAKNPHGSLGLPTGDVFGLVGRLKSGLSFTTLVAFANNSGLTFAEISRVLRIPSRTLARRKSGGKLSALESERLARLAELVDRAVELFEGDGGAALAWLRAPSKALGKLSPLTLAETEQGARAAEDLIGRLEYGVYS